MDRVINEGVNETLLTLIYKENVRAAVPMLVVQFMVTILLCRTQPLNAVLVWICLALAYKSIHLIFLTIVKKHPTIDVHKKLFLFCLLLVCSSSVFAGCLYFFNAMPIIDRIILTMTLFAVALGSTGAYPGDQRFYWSTAIPIMAPLTVLWFANIPADIDPLLSVWIGVLLVVVTGTMAVIGQNTFKFFSSSIKNMQEKDQLTCKLLGALEQQELSKQNAERSNQSKTRLLAAVSHDLRQPVHVLNLFGAALNNAEVKEDTRQVINDMQQAIDDLSQQINVLLDITRLDEISYEPVITQLCVPTLMDIITRSHRAEIKAQGLELIEHYPKNLYVLSDQQLLTQIIRNLLGNAIKYTAQGQITIRLTANAEELMLSIEDTGIGIEETELDSIFEEYYQADNPERNHQKGLGLGLSIVKRAADILEHTITAESTFGKGSKFTICMKREYPTEAYKQPACKAPVANAFNDVKLRVHVVDDDLMVCKSMRSALEAMNCDVSCTQSTESTSEYFSNHASPDLFIIDIRLQGEDSGYKTHRYAKLFHPLAKCVFISGEQDSNRHRDKNDTTQLIRKPVSGEQLEKLLTEARTQTQSASNMTENNRRPTELA